MSKSTELLQIETLGGLAVRLSEREASGFVSRKAVAMLVYLAVEGQAVHRAHLSNLFWEDRSERKAMTNLRVVLSSLKKQLDPFLDITREYVRLRMQNNFYFDALVMERYLAKGDLESGLALYKGDFLESFYIRGCSTFQNWQTVTREHYQLRLGDSLHEGVRQCITDRDFKIGLGFARKLLEMDPYDEIALRRMLELLARDGQRNAALLLFEKYENLYQEELSVKPDPATRMLYDSIRSEKMPIGPMPNFSPIKRPWPVPSLVKLPQPLNPFVGRESELLRLEELLSDPDTGLITILGPGGIGKTRLSVEIGRRMTGHFKDGVVFVPLISLRDPGELVTAIMDVLGFQPNETSGNKIHLLNFLESRELLLLLDNFETILPGAPLVSEIIRAGAGVKVIATSRENLNLMGEYVFRIEGLRYMQELDPSDVEQSDCFRLFLQLAKHLNPAITDQEPYRSEISRICQLVEGMPLAIELAASWVDTLPLSEIGDQIEAGLDILGAGHQDLPQRHRSIRSLFDSSYQALDPKTQACLSAVSVFRGDFSQRAFQTITGATIVELKALVRKSLISMHETGQYQLHELLRRFAAEELSRSPERQALARKRHSHYYRDYLSEIERRIIGGRLDRRQKTQVKSALQNIRAGFRWAVACEDLETIRAYLPGFYYLDSQANLIAIFNWAAGELRQGPVRVEKDILIGHLLCLAGRSLFYASNQPDGRASICEGRSILEQSGPAALVFLDEANLAAANTFAYGLDFDYAPLINQALNNMHLSYRHRNALEIAGFYAKICGDFDQSKLYFRKLLELAEPLYERRWMAIANLGLGMVAEFQGDLESAKYHLLESLKLFTEIENTQMAIAVNKHLGLIWAETGRSQQALKHFRRCLADSRELGLKWRIVESNILLGEMMLRKGALENAKEYYDQAEKKARELPTPSQMSGFLECDLAWLATAEKNYLSAIDRFLGILSRYQEYHSKVLLPTIMARSIPLLEAHSQEALAIPIALAVLKYGPGIQLNSLRPVREFLGKLKAEQGRDAYHALLDQTARIPLEDLKKDLEVVLKDLRDSWQD